MVENGRAARQRQFRESAARGGVLHLVVDTSPDRVERLQPCEEIGVGRTCARERLVEVVVSVDEARCDDGAAQILARFGRVAGAEAGDQPVLDSNPAALVLAAGVVHRHEPAVRENHEASRGTSSKRSTSTRPRSVSLRLGITESARKESSWNGASTVQPRSAAADDDRTAACDHLVERRVREEAGDRQRQLGEHLRAVDGDDAAADVGEAPDGEGHRRVAHPDDDDVVRVVRDGRCERAALQAEAAHEAEPDPAGAEVPLDHGDLREVARGVGDRLAGAHGRLLDERLRHDLARNEADHARLAARARGSGTSPARARRRAPCAAPSRAPRARGISATGRPALSTTSGTNRSRSRQQRADRPGSRARPRRGATARARAPG